METSHSARGARVKSVLVVDDDPALREILSTILEDAGYVASVASDGIEALQSITATLPDLVLLDLSMPRLDGWGVLGALRERGVSLRVILLTSEPDRTRASREGAVACLSTPFRPGELLDTCREVLAAPLPGRDSEG